MAEEFQESEIVFLESVGEDECRCESSDTLRESVNIPRNCVYWDIDGDEGRETVLPHVIVGQRVTGRMMAFSFALESRTLKGRDLSRVRDLIPRMTGFLQT